MDAEQKLCKVILKRMREKEPNEWVLDDSWDTADHLRECDDAWVSNPSYFENTCDFDTCYWTTLQAIVMCPHGKKMTFEYEGTDTVDDLFDEMEQV